MQDFVLNRNTKIQFASAEAETEPVRRAVGRFYRDMEMTLASPGGGEETGGCILLQRKEMEAEAYVIETGGDTVAVSAGSDLGFVYALLFISREYLGILPFWFWNDQELDRCAQVLIPEGRICSGQYRVRFRGWFLNDEVLISHWDGGVNEAYPWEMAFEALLRLGGNMVIPGTDQNAKKYAPLAADMGLWITHHHAEPLGAEMFARAYPQENPSFTECGDLFRGLWRDGIERQKKMHIIWNIGFRGQGDRPFWDDDAACDTPKKRGELISSVMKEQYDMVREAVPDAVFCTNLYGEIMELYRQGFLAVPDDVIMVWADNGYGKMVSRRQGNENPRVPALPDGHFGKQPHGTYYHVSFYDLQAANHITMLPNSMEFVGRELEAAYSARVREFWMVNASNVKPHVYPLDFIANLWQEEPLSAQEHRTKYLAQYYGRELEKEEAESSGTEECTLLEDMADCLAAYAKSTAVFGEHEDEHAGEQFSNYLTRHFISSWMRYGVKKPCESLFWCAKKEHLAGQIQWYQNVCGRAEQAFSSLLEACSGVLSGLERKRAVYAYGLWKDSAVLQAGIQLHCLRGALLFCQAYQAYVKETQRSYMDAFYLLGKAADSYQEAADSMRRCEHNKWRGFYVNECLTDIRQTAYLLRQLMGYVRNVGDGPDFYLWQREVIYPEKDRRVVLITNMENHLTNEELYEEMCRKPWL